MKKIILGISALAALFFIGLPVWAADLEVECRPSGCVLSPDEPLFSEDNIYPGWETSTTILATNKYGQDRYFAIEIINYDDPDGLGEKIEIEIEETNFGGSSLFDGNLTELKNDDYKKLSVVSSDGDREYLIKASLPTEVGNKFKNKSLSFDLKLGFDEEEMVSVGGVGGAGVTSTPTPLPAATATLIPTATLGPTVTPVKGAKEEGEVGGEGVFPPGEEKGVRVVKKCFWWLLSALALVLNSIFVYKKREELKENKRLWLIPALISVLVFLGDKVAHNWWEPSILCNWTWLIAVASFAVPFGFYILFLLFPKQ